MPLGELFLSGFLGGLFNVLIDRLSSPELLDFLRREGFDKKIESCQNTLQVINLLLQDAEVKPRTNLLKNWLEELEELAYDMEDMLDEFEYEAIARKVKMDQLQSNKYLMHVPAGLCSWTPNAARFYFRMRSQVNYVTGRFNQLCELREKLGLQVSTGEAPSSISSVALQKPATSGHRTEPAVYGRDEDIKKILEMVNEPTDLNLTTISIVGMGGLGKTTLAREVFIASNNKFEVTGWVCVSDDKLDVSKISKSILENITGSSFSIDGLDTIHDKIEGKVKGRKLLMVFDDIWNVDFGNWQKVLAPLRTSAAGSRIIITTRNEGIASTLGTERPYEVKYLQPEDCWSIFTMYIKNEVIKTHHDKELICEKVVHRSQGLPIAATTLGGLLSSKPVDEWVKILDQSLWSTLEQEADQILTVLKLSYYYLPSHLKRCFAYCSLFQKNHIFVKEELVFLWIAEGLVQSSRRNEGLEELGCKYFSDLLDRCLFRQASTDDTLTFGMHDLVHDLAIWAFGERGFPSDGVSAVLMQLGRLKKVRHFAYIPTEYDDKKIFQPFKNVEGLKERTRTFLPTPQDSEDYPVNNIANSVIFELLPNLRRLRVLSLQQYLISMLPALLGCLKHLAYMNCSSTENESLPESVSMLYNLQFLVLRHCRELTKLPSNIKYLFKLHHFNLEGCILIKEMPSGMKDLKNLQNLSHFIVGEDGRGSSLKDLKDLKKLRGKIRITRLSNVITCGVSDRILQDKEHLEELLLEWEVSIAKEVTQKRIDVQVLDMLQPHAKLQKLAVKGYPGSRFSSWVGAASYSNMKVLKLKDCEKCESLPSLGLLSSLEELTIKRMRSLKCLGSEFYGEFWTKSFNSLKLLCFEDLPVWTEWVSIEGNMYGYPFPRLQMLSVVDCPQLSGSLPQHLVALEDLTIRNCKQLLVSFSCIPPKLSKLVIYGCKTIKFDNSEEFKSIRYMELSDIAQYDNGLMHECFGKPAVKQVQEKGVSSTSDEIRPQLPCVRELHSLRFLQELFISHISNMVSIPEVCSLPHLKILKIKHCNALISLPEKMKTENKCLESVDISECNSLQFILSGYLPPSLKKLEIYKCEKLERLWDDRGGESCSSSNTNSTQLEYLSVQECHSLTCLSHIVQFPPSLKELCLWNCQGLTKLNQSGELPASLVTLLVAFCDKLTTVAQRFLDSNTSIEVIKILSCTSLLQIPNGLHNLRNLRELTISGSMENFPVEGLAANTHLTKLSICGCPELKALPNGLHSLNSLEEVLIINCPSISSFNPEEVFPTHIKSLYIWEDNVYRSLVGWGLQNLNSLTSLYLDSIPDVDSFPHGGLEVKLPSSLTYLKILNCEKLKKLQGLQQVTPLQSLSLYNCSNLTSFGDKGLPSSVQTLDIDSCPKLEKECKRIGGTEWFKISNIPKVYINNKPIFVVEDEDEINVR